MKFQFSLHVPQRKTIITSFLVVGTIVTSVAGSAVASLIVTRRVVSQFTSMNNVAVQQNATGSATSNTLASAEKDSISSVDAVKKISPSVVSITISKTVVPMSTSQFFPFNDMFGGMPFNMQFDNGSGSSDSSAKPQKQDIGGGTGFIITDDGMILTNKHVVNDDQADYTVTTSDGKKYPATVLAKDPTNDLAIIKIDAKGLTPATLGDSDTIQIGETVIAIGNTLSEYQNTVTRGIVSGVNRRVEAGGSGFSEVLEEAIQTDAAINPGNSGGPLIDLTGSVIGMNTAVNSSGQSIGFAIPINEAKKVIESVKKYGKIVRPFLGVRYAIIDTEMAKANDLSYDHGALVMRGQERGSIAVIPGSPADKAGIVENDIILEINGETIDSQHGLARLLSKYNIGDVVSMKISHQGKEKTIKVTLEEQKEK